MTESEWLASNDPQAMLRHLCPRNLAECAEEGVLDDNILASDRKLRLFAQACCDQYYTAPINENQWAYEPRMRDETLTAFNAAKLWASEVSMNPQKAALLRCIFGNPWSRVALPPGIANTETSKADTFPWCRPLLKNIAQTIYDDRRFQDMPILADALEEAGCNCQEILDHCRDMKCVPCSGEGMRMVDFGAVTSLKTCQNCSGTGMARQLHARGCWVLDLILGKE